MQDYLDHVEAHTRPATVSQYRWALKVFERWAEREGITDVSAITPAVLDNYARALRDEPGSKGRSLSETSRATYVRALGLFLKWAGGPRPKTVRQKDKPLEVLTPEELRQLIEKAPSLRDRLIIELLADTGMRVGELINLRARDVIREGGQAYLNLSGKTGSRTVRISREVTKRLNAYQASLGGYLAMNGATAEAPVFFAHRRHGHEVRPLTVSGVQQMIRQAAAEAGITKRVYPHLLRHTYATHWLAEGGDSVMLQKVLGHSSLAMISRTYSHPTRENLGKAMLEFVKKRDGSKGGSM